LKSSYANYSYLLRIVILFILYFTTARIGLSLDAVSNFATLIWLPTGISIAALLIFGYRLWPAVTLGAFFANLVNGASPMVALGISVGNTMEAVTAVYLLRRFIGFQNTLNKLKDVTGFIIIASILSPVISATIGVGSLLIGQVITSTAFFGTWLAWLLGDMISALLITPLILVWYEKPKVRLRPKRVIEIGGLLSLLIVVAAIVFRGFLGVEKINLPLTFLVFPPLIWASLRFSQREVITTIFALTILATISTIEGLGSFGSSNLTSSLLFLQSFIGTISITCMILSAAISERNQLERRKDDFIHTASHELKTPITTIKGYTQILAKLFRKDSKPKIYLTRMEYQVDRLTGLINDLLDISRIQTNKLELHREIFNLTELIEGVSQDMKQISKKHRITIKSTSQQFILADKFRIGQVLINLISNAIKFSPSNAQIIIRTERKKGMLIVSIQDRGVGIPDENLEKIFEPFYKSDGQSRNSYAGLGLGLYISSEIIKRHGGDMWAESPQKKGSTFFFTLPLKHNERG
jgi:signal transduction histidine kinase